MSDLIGFAKQIEDELRVASRQPHWGQGESESYMAEVDQRRQQFEEIAVQLNDAVIQPRLEILAGYFSNASLTPDEPDGHCACRFGYCERFPASTKISFAVEHDVGFQNLAVCYGATMTPMFVKLNEHDRLTLTLPEVHDESVERWVQLRLLEFLAAYLRIDRGREDFDDEVVTDPVCGMRMNRASAAASDVYQRHPYFFCSVDCHEAFTTEPTEYVEAEPMF